MGIDQSTSYESAMGMLKSAPANFEMGVQKVETTQNLQTQNLTNLENLAHSKYQKLTNQGKLIVTILESHPSTKNNTYSKNNESCPLQIQSTYKNGNNEVTIAGIEYDLLEKSNDRNHNNLNIGDRILEIDEEEIESSQQAYMLLRHAKNNCCRLTILRPDKIVKTSSMTVESEIEDGMLVIRPTNSLKNQNSQKSKISKFSRGSNSTDSDPSQVQEILKKLNINPNVFQTDQLKMISFNNKE